MLEGDLDNIYAHFKKLAVRCYYLGHHDLRMKVCSGQQNETGWHKILLCLKVTEINVYFYVKLCCWIYYLGHGDLLLKINFLALQIANICGTNWGRVA